MTRHRMPASVLRAAAHADLDEILNCYASVAAIADAPDVPQPANVYDDATGVSVDPRARKPSGGHSDPTGARGTLYGAHRPGQIAADAWCAAVVALLAGMVRLVSGARVMLGPAVVVCAGCRLVVREPPVKADGQSWHRGCYDRRRNQAKRSQQERTTQPQ